MNNGSTELPLWKYIKSQDGLSDLDPMKIAQLLRVISEQFEEMYSPTIHTWYLRTEAEHAQKVAKL